MHITRFHLGEPAGFVSTKTDVLAYSYGNRYWYFEDPKREAHQNEVGYGRPEPARGPFDRADFGDRDRLAWAGAACAIPQDVLYAAWAERYAMWFEGRWLCAIDATRTVLVRLGLPIQTSSVKSTQLHAGRAYVESDVDVLVIELADVERLFERTSGSLTVHARELYPHRRPAAKLKVFVEYIFNDSASVVDRDGDGAWLSIPFVPGLERGITVTLHDELMKNHYREIEVPGYARATLTELRPSDVEEDCELFVEPAIDPAGPLTKASTAVRTEELDRVFSILADQPDDDAARLVVIDLLEDAGEPYAVQFAKLLAGDTDADLRREALGTLASYIHELEWRGNLPVAGELSPAAPNDEDIGDLVAGDHRLGFFHTLRLGDGNFRVYSKLVASPRAVGLRHVDGSRAAILQALIAGRRRDLRRLSNVKFATREVLETLADSTFDRVVEIETETQANVVGRLLDFIARDELAFFARAPRHLVLRERNGDDDGLVQPVLAAWSRLPLDKLTMGGVTIARDGTARAVADASSVARDHVAARFRFA